MTTTDTNTATYTIDATGRRLGDVATEAARVLLGKTNPDYARHRAAPVSVVIEHAAALDIPYKKRGEIYQRYSGYPGGRNTETLIHLAERQGYAEVVRRTISGMIPNNKLKKPRLANLTISE